MSNKTEKTYIVMYRTHQKATDTAMVRATDTADVFKKLEEFIDRTSKGRDRLIYAKVKGVYYSPVYSDSYGIETS